MRTLTNTLNDALNTGPLTERRRQSQRSTPVRQHITSRIPLDRNRQVSSAAAWIFPWVPPFLIDRIRLLGPGAFARRAKRRASSQGRTRDQLMACLLIIVSAKLAMG